MSRFVLSPAAEADLDAIDDATIARFGLEQAVANRETFHESFRTLAEMPRLGHTRVDLSPPGRAFLYWTVLGRFIIVYEPVAGGRGGEGGIRVARVLDGAGNLGAELQLDPGDETEAPE